MNPPTSEPFRDTLTALLQWVAEHDPAAAARALAEWEAELAKEQGERPARGGISRRAHAP